MGRPQSTSFFATGEDIRSKLADLEAECNVKYVVRGLLPSPEPIVYHRIIDVPLGASQFESAIANVGYMILPAQSFVGMQQIPQRRGGVLYSFDELTNAEAVILYVGGLFRDTHLVMSLLLSSSEPSSITQYRRIRHWLLRGSIRVSDYWVAPEAQRLREQGVALCESAGLPPAV
jgi:hypothetical protein